MKKMDGYPHNRYLTDMNTGTGWKFIQRVGYGGATTRTLPAPLTSLILSLYIRSTLREKEKERKREILLFLNHLYYVFVWGCYQDYNYVRNLFFSLIMKMM